MDLWGDFLSQSVFTLLLAYFCGDKNIRCINIDKHIQANIQMHILGVCTLPLIVTAAIIITMDLAWSFTAICTISSVALLSTDTSSGAGESYALLKNTDNTLKPGCCGLCLSEKWSYAAASWKGFFRPEQLPGVCAPVLQLPADDPRPPGSGCLRPHLAAPIWERQCHIHILPFPSNSKFCNEAVYMLCNRYE